MIIRNDSGDSEEEIEDEFTELLRQIDDQRQIERPLHNLELRQGSPIGHLDHHQAPDDDSDDVEDCCIHDDEQEPKQHFRATSQTKFDKDDTSVYSAMVSPLDRKNRGTEVFSPEHSFMLGGSLVSQEPKFPILVKRAEPAKPVATSTQEVASRRASPRKILLKKIDRNPSTPTGSPLPGKDVETAAATLVKTEILFEPEPIKVPSIPPTIVHSYKGKIEEDSRGSCTSPDSVMDILLEEMEGYVAENNILYHENSPEKEAEPSPSLDSTSKESHQEVATTSDVSKGNEGSSHSPSIIEESLTENQGDTCEDEIMYDASESHSSSPIPPKRRIRFADDHGLPLFSILHLDHVMATEGRLVILLLSPPERTFEFIQVEYPMDDSTTINDLVEQLPGLATNAVFQGTNCFVGVSRIRTLRNDKNETGSTDKGMPTSSPQGGSESSGSENSTTSTTSTPTSTSLSNVAPSSCRLPTLLGATALMRDIDFGNCELVLAVLDGYTPAQMVTFAFPLLLNGKIMKAVQAGRRSGRGLKYVLSGKGWKKEQYKHSLCVEEKRQDWHNQYPYKEWAVVNSLCDNVIVFEIDIDEYADSWECRKSTNDVCSVKNGEEMVTDISTGWDDWWKDFQPDDTFTAKEAPRTVKRKDDALEISSKKSTKLDLVNAAECQPSSEYGETTNANLTTGEVCAPERELSPRSVVDAPESRVSISLPLLVARYNNEAKGGDAPRNEDDPIIWGYIGGQQGAENVILMIYAFSIAGVAGLLSRL